MKQVKEYSEIYLLHIFHVSNLPQILHSVHPYEKSQCTQTRCKYIRQKQLRDVYVVTTFTIFADLS